MKNFDELTDDQLALVIRWYTKFLIDCSSRGGDSAVIVYAHLSSLIQQMETILYNRIVTGEGK